MKQKLLDHFNGSWHDFYPKYLQGVKKIGGQEYQALCPFHQETNPSFNFNNETGAYFCHGCGKKGAGFHFYARTHGLDDRRDFPKVLRGIASDFGIPWEEQERKLVKTYDYTDQDGKLLFQVCRFEPKDFRQRRPDGKSWKWDLKGIEPVLYRLPEVLKAEEVIIVEGEKDADNLAALGFVATTCAMGARKWRDHYNEALNGKRVILCPDNDREGQEHMTQVAMSLNGNSKSLKWLELPGLPSKGDVSDFIATYGEDKDAASERLAIMIQNADIYKPPEKKSLEDIIMTTFEFHALDLPERATFLNPWLKEDSITLASGWRGVGKTWFSWGVADAITRGQPFGPWKCEKPVPVLILDGEMPTTDLQERIKALGLNTDRPCPLHIYSDAYANQHGLPRAHLGSESWRDKMKSILLARHVKLWIVDNLASLAGGMDENKKLDWDPINAWLLELRFAGIATMLLHHVGKLGVQRGTSAREDNIDVSIILKAPVDYTPDDGCRFICSFSKARVGMAGLPLIADTEFKLMQEESGAYVWAWANVRKERKREILKMLDEGCEYDAICSTVGITKGYVTKIKKQAIKDNLLTNNGKLSQSGFLFVSEC